MSGPLVSASAAFVAKNSRIPPYAIEQSLRFDGGSKLERTNSDNGDSRSFTLSYWIKKTYLGDNNNSIVGTNDGGSNWSYISYGESSSDPDQLLARSSGSGSGYSNGYVFNAQRKHRDPSAWQHHFLVVDKTAGTSKGYINGVLDEGDGGYGGTRSSNGWTLNGTTATVRIGAHSQTGTSNYLNGYLADWYFVDGTAMDVTDFGGFDDYGIWRPINPSISSYGTNGYYLKFDSTAANGVGHDHSGNGNNWTASGFTTSGTGTDVMSDTPTTNWCTLNPLDVEVPSGTLTIDNGNLDATSSSTNSWKSGAGTLGVSSGKWYWEATLTNESQNNQIGVINAFQEMSSLSNYFSAESDGWALQSNDNLYNGGATGERISDQPATGDIIGVALDADNGKLWFSVNGSYQSLQSGQAAGNPSTGTNAIFTNLSGYTLKPAYALYSASNETSFNFGQREFAYPPGTSSATQYFNTVTWTGNGSTQSITGVGFQPDLVWSKKRSGNQDHFLFDVVRGSTNGNFYELRSSNTVSQGVPSTSSSGLTSLDSDGFTVGSDGSVNTNNDTYVAWCWKAGGAASDNTDGDITSSVSVNQDAGFSVVKYTSQSTKPLNVGHGLGKKPDFILTKNLDATASWGGYHSGTGATKSMFINTTGSGTVSVDYFNNTEPTDSVFTVFDSNNTHSYGTSNEFIAYCWTEKAGVSKFGTYTGNGSSTGPFIECGFKPRLVIVKRTDATSNWFMYDTIRGTNNKLYAENTGAENSEDGGSTSSNTILSLSTGFQMTSGNGSNTNGGTYIFMAWAENFSADATYKALNTSNLPAPEIKDGSDYFNTVLYTGNGSTQSITGVGFQSDFTWIKKRDSSGNHMLTDAVRGANTELNSNTTAAETANTNALTSFDTDGFSVGSDGAVNISSENLVAWNWLAGGSGSNNTDGSITSTVSANPTAGFSIVTYTGTGANATVGHGLGVGVDFILIKSRSNGSSWQAGHSGAGWTKYAHLDLTNAFASASSVWQDTAPTSTVFSLGNETGVNGLDRTYVAYCFAEVEGYSKMSSWTGNGLADGPFIFTGFRPSFLLFKRSNLAEDWVITDSVRRTYNQMNGGLRPNSSAIEWSTDDVAIDFTANGFKIRSGDAKINASGSTYIFMALAENPFGGSGVNPATAP